MDELLPLILEMLQDSSSLQKREVIKFHKKSDTSTVQV